MTIIINRGKILMNKHIFWDNFTVTLARLFIGKNKFFSESIESPSLREHIDNIELDVPEINGTGIYEVKARTLAGDLDPAFKIVRWKGDEHPLIIFHHGSNERPFQSGRFAKNAFNRIFLHTNYAPDVNLIALRAPFHNGSTLHYQRSVTKLTNFAAMLSVSVKVAEYLISYFKQKVNGTVALAGISLGGWVTNLHRAYFNTADVYIPIMAGADVGDVFIRSVYGRLAGRRVREQPDSINKTLNFAGEFEQVKDDNVYPLLARYDQYIRYDVQKSCFGNRDIAVLENGHITGALNSDALREHIKKVMKT